MSQSEEQPKPEGPCLYCGASVYRLPNGKLWSDNPAPGCLCRVEPEDEAEERKALIKKTIGNIKEGEDQDWRERLPY